MTCAAGATTAQVAQTLKQDIYRNTCRSSDLIPGKETVVCAVDDALPQIPRRLAAYNCRNNALLLAAYLQIADDVDGLIRRHGRDRVGVVIGSSTSGIGTGTVAMRSRLGADSFPDDFEFAQQEMGSAAAFLAEYIGVKGPAYSVSTACASSARTFLSGRSLLAAGHCDAVIIGGADTLCELTLQGFDALETVAPTRCNPMSRNRSGITIGEAAAVFILTREPADIALLGIGDSSDAYHISAPEENGAGAEAAMRAALADAGLAPGDIAYINLHGTGTVQNDAMESLAVNRVFGCGVPCSSTKALTGHTLGAAGALEIGLCCNVLSRNTDGVRFPYHIWDGHRDTTLPALSLVTPDHRLSGAGRCVMLSNSFAFGGNNCAVVIGST